MFNQIPKYSEISSSIINKMMIELKKKEKEATTFSSNQLELLEKCYMVRKFKVKRYPHYKLKERLQINLRTAIQYLH